MHAFTRITWRVISRAFKKNNIYIYSHTCFYRVSKLAINPVVFIKGCYLQHRGAGGRRLMGHGVVHGVGKIRNVIVGVLHCHQYPRQVAVKWKLLILDLEWNERWLWIPLWEVINEWNQLKLSEAVTTARGGELGSEIMCSETRTRTHTDTHKHTQSIFSIPPHHDGEDVLRSGLVVQPVCGVDDPCAGIHPE